MKKIFALLVTSLVLPSAAWSAESAGTSMHCNQRGFFQEFSDYFFMDMTRPETMYVGVASSEGVGNYEYTQDFRVLEYSKNDACATNCYTIVIAEPRPRHNARRLTIKPAPGFAQGIYRLEAEFRARPDDAWSKSGSPFTCIVPQEITQR